MPTVMVIGASRGIGLELARQYAAAGWRVHATTRTPTHPGALGPSRETLCFMPSMCAMPSNLRH